MRRTDFLQMADKLAQAGGAITGALYQKEQLGEAKKAMDEYRNSQVVQSVLNMLPEEQKEPYLSNLSTFVKEGKAPYEASKLALGSIWDKIIGMSQPGKERTTGTPLLAAQNTVQQQEASKPINYFDMAKTLGASLPTPPNYVQPMQ